MSELKGLPLGIQNFSEIIEQNLLYVDKTEYIHKLATTGKLYLLLASGPAIGQEKNGVHLTSSNPILLPGAEEQMLENIKVQHRFSSDIN